MSGAEEAERRERTKDSAGGVRVERRVRPSGIAIGVHAPSGFDAAFRIKNNAIQAKIGFKMYRSIWTFERFSILQIRQ
jgi:hypothetical protein